MFVAEGILHSPGLDVRTWFLLELQAMRSICCVCPYRKKVGKEGETDRPTDRKRKTKRDRGRQKQTGRQG